jgi:hypothetical protein
MNEDTIKGLIKKSVNEHLFENKIKEMANELLNEVMIENNSKKINMIEIQSNRSDLKENVVNSINKVSALNKIADVQEAELDTVEPFVELVFVTKSPELKFYIAFDLEEKKFDTIKYDQDVNKTVPQLSQQLTKNELKSSYPDVYKASVYDIATIGDDVMKFFEEPEVNEVTMLESIELKTLEDFYEDEIGEPIDESIIFNEEKVDLDKYRDLLGSNFKELDDKELMSYLKRQFLKRQATTNKDLKKQLEKDPEFQRQIKIDKYKYPYIHPSTAVKIVDGSGKEFDLEKLKSVIKKRPTKILKQNEKIQHSGGKTTIYYNIGLPALKGLAVNEKTDKIVVVDTCPGAGQCKVYCYAKKGGYVQYENAPIAGTQMLNFLVNDPNGFSNMLETELSKEIKKADKKNSKIVVRWHDSGDMFSKDYLDLAYNIARKFPSAEFYAYTKLANVATGNKPDNFIMNFSAGAKKPEERNVDLSKTKHSTVVPKQMFDDLITKDDNGKVVRNEKNQIQFTPENLLQLKKKLSLKYGVPAGSILSYEEMKNTPESDEVGKYNVIVRPGDGDESANRKDVRGTYLLIH